MMNISKTVALIPVRGGSKSIPLKNIRKLGGYPLVYWTAKAAAECSRIDEVYIATDSEPIAQAIKEFGLEKVHVIGRSEETATDTASTESVMLEFAGQYEFETIVLIQATSPLLQAEDLERGMAVYDEPDTDSVLSAVSQKRFCWGVSEDGYAQAENYDIFHRQRRQDFAGYFVENGAFYITSRERLLKTKNRLSGNIRICEMPEETFYELDEPSDWVMIEQLMKLREGGLL